MAITVRLSKVGKRNAPAYKIVVMNVRDKRYGKFLDVLGHFNPSQNPASYSLNEEKLKSWVEKGAGITKAVEELRKGTYVHKPYAPHKKDKKSNNVTETNEEIAEKTEEPVVPEADENVEIIEETSEEVVE